MHDRTKRWIEEDCETKRQVLQKTLMGANFMCRGTRTETRRKGETKETKKMLYRELLSMQNNRPEVWI